MSYRATIQNAVTKRYLNTKGYWVAVPISIAVETRGEAHRLAGKMNAVVVKLEGKQTVS